MRFSAVLVLFLMLGMFAGSGCGSHQSDASTTPSVEKQKATDADMQKLVDQAKKGKKR